MVQIKAFLQQFCYCIIARLRLTKTHIFLHAMNASVLSTSLLCALCLSAPLVFAVQQSPVTVPIEEATAVVKSRQKHTQTVQAVQVSGMKDQDWKPYRQMLNGLNAFERHHALAPETQLRFIVRPQVEGLVLADIRLKIVGDTIQVPIVLAANGSFELPRNQKAADENADLVLNQKQNWVRWNLLALRTPTLSTHQRRIGDLRLTCEVFAAMENIEKLRREFNLRGVTADNLCESPRLNWTFYENQGLKSARIFNESRSEVLPLSSDHRGFTVNLFDRAWGNNALIELEFAVEE